jgi:hypothetical protein
MEHPNDSQNAAAQPPSFPLGEAGHAPHERSEVPAPGERIDADAPCDAGAHAPPPPSSARRIASSRANGRKSRGPITPEGKARSSRNAITHGLCARDVVLPVESPRSFEALRSAIFDTLKPVNPVAARLAEAILVARWRQSRIWEVETAMLTDATEAHPDTLAPAIRLSRAFRTLANEPSLLLLDRYETRYERQFARAIRLYLQINQSDPDFFQTNLIPQSDTPPASTPAASDPTKNRGEAASSPRGEAEHAPCREAAHAPGEQREADAPCDKGAHAPGERSEPQAAPTLVGSPARKPLLFLDSSMKPASVLRVAGAFLFLLLFAASGLRAAVTVNAAKPAPPPRPLPFEAGGRSPDGRTLSINSRYLSLDGKPWFPVMGEFHYSRYAPEEWETELRKMKAGGVSIVSTYVFWIHHEEVEGRFDWSGRRDLRRFIELAAKAGLYVWVRIGPWDHGEVRNGGLPDWVLAKSKPRSNDPAYLAFVQRFYGETAAQLRGLYWKDGGPIAGIQIENEYHDRGPGKGEEHILTLLGLAKKAGIDAPFYTVTAWDDAAVPSTQVVPIFGGYPEGFWHRNTQPSPPSADYFFTPIRRDETVDDRLQPKRADTDAKYAAYPFLTAEMAGGMAASYHRRPIMTADDIAALGIAKLGSGVAAYGYYMFHGGTNPEGSLTTLQESQATGYWNDLPLKGYDYQAPIGEFGQVRPLFRALKSVHLFLNDFGSALAPMAAYFPQARPSSRQDRDTPRVAARSDSKSAYIFVNNYQKDWPLPERRDFQVAVTLASGTVIAPRRPITVPAGAYFFWPVETKIGDAALAYATAQPLCRLDDPDTTVFFAWPGIDAEFSFHDAPGLSVEAPAAKVARANGRIDITGITPGLGAAITIRYRNRVSQILVTTREQAGNIWKARLAGRDRLIYSAAGLYFESDRVHVSSADPQALAFAVYPSIGKASKFHHGVADGVFECYTAQIAPVSLAAAITQTAEPKAAAPARIGQEVALVPDESAFQAAGRWTIQVPKLDSPNLADAILRISYIGDIARLSAGGKLFTDEFYKGTPWEIGLRHLPAGDAELAVLPLRADAPIYFTSGSRPEVTPGTQAARVTQVTVIPIYQAVAEIRP